MNICPECGTPQQDKRPFLKKKTKAGVTGILKPAVCAAVVAAMMISAACDNKSGASQQTDPTTTTSELIPWEELGQDYTTLGERYTYRYGTGPEVIQVWSYTDEITDMARQFVKLNPEFGEKYTIDCILISSDLDYQWALDNALASGGDMAPDIYMVEADFINKYTQGNFAKYAATYKELGIDVDTGIKEADIAKYSVDIGSRNGEVVALAYQGSGSAMIYNAEIAKDVFGTDDPEQIEKITGAGSGDWDKFFKAADQLKAKGYAALSGPSDIWKACESSSDIPWVVDGKLQIDPKREKYLDLAKTIVDKGYSNKSQSWSEAWFKDMRGEGERKVFAFFGPSWLINYVMVKNSGGSKPGEGTYGQWRVCAPPVSFFWGGTWVLANKDTRPKEGVAEFIEWITLDTSETGLQYLLANGMVDWDNDPETKTLKDGVVSITVMSKSDGKLDFCGGQDTFVAFVQANNLSSGKAVSQYDEVIGSFFKDAADRYAEGKITKEEAIENFKREVKENVSF